LLKIIAQVPLYSAHPQMFYKW